MSNSYYTPPTDVAALTRARSGDINLRDDAVDAAFDKVPDEAKLKRGTVNYAVTGGAADAYTVTLPYVPSGYVDGLLVNAYIHATNTGASTVNVNSLGVKSIKLQGGGVPLAGDLQKFVDLRYSTTTGFFHAQGNTAGSVSDAAASAAAAAASASAASSSASSASSSAASAAASYDSFDDRYLGAKASDPTLDNDGNALLTGALYFNTTSNTMRIYTGSAWLASTASAVNVAFTPAATIAATNVQAAIEEVVSDLAAPSGAGVVGMLQAGAGAVASTLQAQARERVSISQFYDAAFAGDYGLAARAANTFAAITGKAVHWPAANYDLKSYVGNFGNNTAWIGEPGTVINLPADMMLGAVIGGTARGLYAQAVSNLSFDGITFQSATTGLTKAITIAFDQITGLRLTKCTIKDFGNATYYAQGCIVFNSTDVRIRSNTFTNCSGDGLAFSNSVTNFDVSDNEFSSNDDWGFAISIACTQGSVTNNRFISNVSTATGADRCTNIAFSNNTMVNNEHGIRVTKFAATADVNRGITIIGNIITNCGAVSISIEQAGDNGTGLKSQVTVIGNTINGSGNQGVNVIDSQDVSIVGNTIYSTAAEAILIHASTAGWESGRVTVIGNTILTCTYGVRQIDGAGTLGKSTIIGNHITFASVATMALLNADYIDGDASANYLDISKTFNLPSGIVSATASIGGIAVPANCWQFLPIYFGGSVKKIAVFND